MISVDRIYAATAAPRIRLHPVEGRDLLALNRAVRETERMAHGENTLETIATYISSAKSARFVLAATPLPGGASNLRLASLAARARASEDELRGRVSAAVLERFKAIAPAIEQTLPSREEPPCRKAI